MARKVALSSATPALLELPELPPQTEAQTQTVPPTTRTGNASTVHEPPPSPLLAPEPLDATTAVTAAVHVGRWNREGAALVTASKVEHALESGDFSGFKNAPPKKLLPLLRSVAEAYTVSGPLGSHGPLSRLGPLGDEPWNPSRWMKSIGGWEKLSNELTALDGPGSSKGPLGDSGALQHRGKLKNIAPGLSEQLDAGGVFTALGPFGPLGPLGPLGYLGPIGGHGFAQDDKGRFVNEDGVVRTTDVMVQGKKRSFELVEMMSASDAKAETQDTSWMVRGTVAAKGESDAIQFSPRGDRLLTLCVVPEKSSDVFSIELFSGGKSIAKSDSDTLMNFIQIPVEKAEKLEVRVTLKKQAPKALHPAALAIEAATMPLVLWGDVMSGKAFLPKEPGAAYRLFAVGAENV